MKILQKAIGVLLFASFTLSANAQQMNVENTSIALKTYGRKKESLEIRKNALLEAKKAIDEAFEYTSTSNDPKMWKLRAQTYLSIQTDTLGEDYKPMIKDEDAIEKAIQSLIGLFKADEKERYTEEAETQNVFTNVAVNGKFIADVAYNAKDYERSIKYYQLTRSLVPLDKQSQLKRYNITDNGLLFNIATTEKFAGKTAKAKGHYEELINRSYNDPWIYMDLYDIYLNGEKDTVSALETIDKGRLMFDENAQLKRLQIYVYDISGRSNELLDILNESIEMDPYNAKNYYLRALMKVRMGKKEDAIADFEKSLELNDQDIQVNEELGQLYYERAADYAEEANALPFSEADKFNELNEKSVESFKKSIPCFERIKNYSSDPKQSGRAAQFLMQMYLKTGQMDKYKEIKAEYE
ncbi:MAG: hypothetical protein RIC15_08345 [Vicingaceae bacterium]